MASAAEEDYKILLTPDGKGRNAKREALGRILDAEREQCIKDVCWVCAKGVSPIQTHIDVWVHRIGSPGSTVEHEFQCPANGIRNRIRPRELGVVAHISEEVIRTASTQSASSKPHPS